MSALINAHSQQVVNILSSGQLHVDICVYCTRQSKANTITYTELAHKMMSC